jgi:aspartate kinase
MVVMKFGGSSVESAEAIERVASIVRECDRRPVVVVSAMGKTTDRLLAIARFCEAGNRIAALRELASLRTFHSREAARLVSPAQAVSLDRDICLHFKELEEVLIEVSALGTLTPAFSDAVLSFGERLSSLIVTTAFRHAGIDATHLDARRVIVTDDRHTRALPLTVETNALLRRKVSDTQVTVIGGFIGATEDGVTTTLGRGGSDYTAAIVGAAICAEEIQIWTDVDGMLTCDPRLVPDGHCLKSISYVEAEELARSGAKVLHPATVAPAVWQKIPIAIRNSRNPAAPGTRIVAESPCNGVVMSIACRKDVSLLHLRAPRTPLTSEFGRQVWEVFERAGVSFELISPSVRRFSLAVAGSDLTPDFLQEIGCIADMEIEPECAVISLVGQNASRNSANLARASQRLGEIRGGSTLTYCTDSRFAFVVAESSVVGAAQALHDEFFQQPDGDVLTVNRRSLPVEDKSSTPVVRTRGRRPVVELRAGC